MTATDRKVMCSATIDLLDGSQKPCSFQANGTMSNGQPGCTTHRRADARAQRIAGCSFERADAWLVTCNTCEESVLYHGDRAKLHAENWAADHAKEHKNSANP